MTKMDYALEINFKRKMCSSERNEKRVCVFNFQGVNVKKQKLSGLFSFARPLVVLLGT